MIIFVLFVCLFGFLTSSSTTRLYPDGPQDKSVWQFYVLLHMRQSWETMTSVSAGHIIQTPTQPVGSGRPQRESNPGPPHQESRALPQSYRAPRNDNQRAPNTRYDMKVTLTQRRYKEFASYKNFNQLVQKDFTIWEREKSICVVIIITAATTRKGMLNSFALHMFILLICE